MSIQTQAKAESGQSLALKAALEALMKLGGELITDDSIKRGPDLVIPHNMTYMQVAQFCVEKEKEDQEVVAISRKFPYRGLDGAVATERAIKKAFGTVKHKGTMGFWGPNPPEFIDVEVGPSERLQVPWGRFQIAAIPGCDLTLGAEHDPELGEVFMVYGSVKRKFRAAVEALFQLIEDELQTNSIYKGKAIDGGFNYLDLSRVDKDRLVYAEDALRQLETHVLGPIRHGEVLAKAGVNLKSAVLLSGTYGVGKTEFGYLAAQEAVQKELTFIQVRPGRDNITDALRIARQYGPAVVFVEDIDLLTSAEDGRDVVEVMLEQFDGLRAKGTEVLAILTTNHPERIHKGMLRPGRIDFEIELTTPDAPGVIKLCKALIQEDLLSPDITDEEWEEIGKAGLGYIPAFIAAACKNVVKFTVARTGGELGPGCFTGDDICAALDDMRSHWRRMNDASDQITTHHLDDLVEDLVEGKVTEVLNRTVLSTGIGMEVQEEEGA